MEHLDAVETWLRDICRDSITPDLDVDILKMELPNAEGTLMPIFRVDVHRSLYVHESPGGYYRRIGSSKTRMGPEHLARLMQERSQIRTIRFDESVVPRTRPEDMHYSLTDRFLEGDVEDVPETPEEALQLLRKMRIVADDDAGDARLTLAGALLCTPEPQQWLPHAYIQAVSYAGRTDGRRLPDRRPRSPGTSGSAGRRGALLCAPQHAGSGHKAYCPLGTPSVQRPSGVRSPGERRGTSRLLLGGRPDSASSLRRPVGAVRSGCPGQYSDGGELAPETSQPERAGRFPAGTLSRPDGRRLDAGAATVCRSFSTSVANFLSVCRNIR